MTTQTDAVLAVDVGGTTVKSAVIDLTGGFRARHVIPTGRDGAAQDAVRGSVATLLSRAQPLGVNVVAAGVVAPGVIDEQAGVVRYASNLAWRDVSLRELLSDVVDAPVAVGHDVRAAAEAEELFGISRGSRDYVHICIGTGIAASLVVGGQYVAGSAGGAGELGHIPVRADGETCLCGQRGCLEVYASGAGIARRYRQLRGRPADAREVVEQRRHDVVARRVWTDAVESLVTSMATLTLLLEPEVIVLGGGLALAGPALSDPVRAGLDQALSWRKPPVVELSALGSDAATLGAAVLALRAATLPVDREMWRR